MPLKLIPPSAKRRTPYYSVRGTYLGIHVDRSTKADRLDQAKKVIKLWREQIERGEYRTGKEVDQPAGKSAPTFADAALAYIRAGGERRFLGPAIDQLGTKLLADIDQAAIDAGASASFPNGTAAYRNRNFYTPVSAVLKHVGHKLEIKRPKGWRGKRSTAWLEEDQAFALFKAADKIEAEFGLFLRTLCYTGMRLSECLNITLREINLKTATIYLPDTKNGEARPVHLPAHLVAALANHPRGLNRAATERLFHFRVNGHLRKKFSTAKAAAGIVLPPRQGGFHVFCHTYGTWMNRLGMDAWDLTETGRWKDPASAKRYSHTEPGAAARKSDLFPVEKRRRR